MEEDSSLTTCPVVQPSQADQDISFIAQNILMETSRLAKLSRVGQFKSQANKGRARSKRAREGGEDVTPTNH